MICWGGPLQTQHSDQTKLMIVGKKGKTFQQWLSNVQITTFSTYKTKPNLQVNIKQSA